jgi:para-aminobenzoate synthetase/4-amino-4-deoxychorismate lyase
MTALPSSSDPAAVFAPASGGTGAILLETQRPNVRDRHTYLLKDPEKILSATRPGDVAALLAEAQDWQARGYPVAGFLAYEAGYALEETFAGTEAEAYPFPLAWFGVYPGYLRFDHLRGSWRYGGSKAPPWDEPGDASSRNADVPADPPFSMTEDEYAAGIEKIRGAIAEGEVYQANLTGRFGFPFRGDPFALYLRLRAVQPVPYGAFLRTESGCVVSLSPELFFRVRGGKIETRPMKGTAARGLSYALDREAANSLKKDPKNRAENVMIVDLLRNDLGKVCRTGSVKVPRLFEVQRYRTVLQMVSTVTGELAPGTGLLSLMRALFPCGSITGAPKISAMRLLRRLEAAPRGVYTGAIGILLPGSDMTFSVAIRTVTVENGRAELGAGGGIVWDSEPAAEFREARQKALFLTEPPLSFELIETFLYRPETGFRFLKDHLARLCASAGYFGFRFRRDVILAALSEAIRKDGGKESRKVRLRLRKGGQPFVETSPWPSAEHAAGPYRVTLSSVRVSSRDPFVRHKTTHRAFRDEALAKARDAGFDEVLFQNERGELTEGAITNVFLEIGGRLYTPPASSGLLEGVFRKHVLRDRARRASARVLYGEDLAEADRIFLTNSVRGIVPARFTGEAPNRESAGPFACEGPAKPKA